MLVQEGRGGCKIIAHKVRLYVLNEMPQIINIYQYITENIISPNSTVYIPYKNKIYLLRFLSLILILKCKQVLYFTSNHFLFIKQFFDKVSFKSHCDRDNLFCKK